MLQFYAGIRLDKNRAGKNETGWLEKTVVGSVVESLILDSENQSEYGRLKEIFQKDSLQMASFTITDYS